VLRYEQKSDTVGVFGYKLAYQLDGGEEGRRTWFVGRSLETCSSDLMLEHDSISRQQGLSSRISDEHLSFFSDGS